MIFGQWTNWNVHISHENAYCTHLRTTKTFFRLNLILWNFIAMKSLKKSLIALEEWDGLQWTRAHFAICFWDEYLALKTNRRPLLQNIYLDHSMRLLVTHMHDLQFLTRNQVSVIKTKNAFQMCQNAEIKIRAETLLLVYPPPFFSLLQTLIQLLYMFVYIRYTLVINWIACLHTEHPFETVINHS